MNAPDHRCTESVIDVQVHIWFTNRPSRPWIPNPWAGRTEHARVVFAHQLALSCSAETALDEIAVAGVRSAVLAPLGVYGFDNALELDASAEHPGLHPLVAIDHTAPDVARTLDSLLAAGACGVRFAPMDWRGLTLGEYDDFFRAAAHRRVPVFLNLQHPLPAEFDQAVKRYRDIAFVIDHLGVGSAPPVQPAGDDPFARLTDVLALARHPNTYLKLSAVPALSRLGFPFTDIHEAITSAVGRFSPERVMWGSDFTRTNPLYSYSEGLDYLWHVDGLGDKDLRSITGGTAASLLGIENDPTAAPRT